MAEGEVQKEYSNRKEFVKEQRKRFVSDPKNFFLTEIVHPTVVFWKEKPLKAIFTFFIWVIVYYVGFGLVQAVNNDMIYCDSTIDSFDGKLMYTFNDFVAYYNDKANRMQTDMSFASNFVENYSPTGQFELNQIDLKKQQEEAVRRFNEEYSMICKYNVTRWINEPILSRSSTIYYGFQKIILKRR